jgi:hypothetical protein
LWAGLLMTNSDGPAGTFYGTRGATVNTLRAIESDYCFRTSYEEGIDFGLASSVVRKRWELGLNSEGRLKSVSREMVHFVEMGATKQCFMNIAPIRSHWSSKWSLGAPPSASPSPHVIASSSGSDNYATRRLVRRGHVSALGYKLHVLNL